MTHYIALIPFILTFFSFVALRKSLVFSTTLALASALLMNLLYWHATASAWDATVIRMLETVFEIGFIIAGAFFFLETATETRIIASLSGLVKEITSVRVYQGVLVCFSLALMVEGSSGFGTPFLIVIPLLLSLGFPLFLCALLPFLNVIFGIPYGALGTPLRLGFEQASALSIPVFFLSIPFIIVGPIASSILVLVYDDVSKKQKISLFQFCLWILSVSSAYGIAGYFSAQLGPEFPALAGGFASFSIGIILIRLFTPSTQRSRITHYKGLVTYFILLVFLWAGKEFWMDETFPGTHLRIFNPGWVFFIVSTGILLYEKLFNSRHWHPHEVRSLFTRTFHRGKRTIWVLFCMTFIVQVVRNNGALDALTVGIPSVLKNQAAGLLGWIGTMCIGTSTVTNMLLSRVVNPGFAPALALGSSIGVQLTFQTLVATRGALNDRLTESQLFKILAPVSLGCMLFLTLLVIYFQSPQ